MPNKPQNPDMHYQTHVFCCENVRPPDHPRSCCSARGSVELRNYMKTRAKQLGIENIRINGAGCLERCELGPTLVIYPEGAWYRFDTEEDIDEILERHIINGERVERLFLEPGQKFPKPRVSETISLKVAAIRDETPDIKVMELVGADGGELPPFTAGAHIDVVIGESRRRSYSLANDPNERHRYVIGVLRETDGRGGSVWMHDSVRAGDVLEAHHPLNNFPLTEDAGEHILIAGGIGITPILAMGYRLKEIGATVSLHYCTRSAEQTAFTKEVKQMFGDAVTFYHDGGDARKGIKLNVVLAVRPDNAHVYVCGPTGLMDATLEAASHRWPDETVHREYFTPKPVTTTSKNEEFEIALSRHKKILTVPSDKTILDVVRAAGIVAESSCEDGLCGTCETRLLSGNAEHRDSVLTKKEKEENKKIMICVSRAKKGERLVLDL
jgi:vanillate O-demethylase ferredoxin subunit